MLYKAQIANLFVQQPIDINDENEMRLRSKHVTSKCLQRKSPSFNAKCVMCLCMRACVTMKIEYKFTN